MELLFFHLRLLCALRAPSMGGKVVFHSFYDEG